MTKVVFLDIDGVLNGADFCAESLKDEEGLESWIDPLCVKRLLKILKETGAKVVFSTSWREMIGGTFDGMDRPYVLEDLADVVGVGHSDVLGTIPKLMSLFERGFDPVNRGNAIRAWLEENQDLEISHYVILEDMPDSEMPTDKTVRTSYMENGLQDKHVDEAIRILTSC